MSKESVELVRRSLERFNSGDLDGALRDADPELEWHDLRELPGATVRHGREAAAEHLRSVLRALPGYHVDTDELVDLGGTVVVCGRVSAHGRTSDVPVERPYFAVYTFDAGRVRRVSIFGSRAEALEAAELIE